MTREEWLEGLAINTKVWAWHATKGKHLPATVVSKNVWWDDDDECTEVTVEVRFIDTGFEYEFGTRGCEGLLAAAPKFVLGQEIVQIASAGRCRVVDLRPGSYTVEGPVTGARFQVPFDSEALYRAASPYALKDRVEVLVNGAWLPGAIMFNDSEHNVLLNTGGVVGVVADKVAEHLRRPAPVDPSEELARVRAQLAVCEKANKDLQAAAYADRQKCLTAEHAARAANDGVRAKDQVIADLTAARTRFADVEKENRALRDFIRDARDTLNKLHERLS